MDINILNKIAVKMVADSKGILAIDESHGTCKKRFDALNINVTEENRRSYRDMLISANSLSDYISGAILFDETIRQKTSDGSTFPDYLNKVGIGTKNLPDAIRWHFAFYWEHAISKKQLKNTYKSKKILENYIAVPILLKKSVTFYKEISKNLANFL